MGGSGICEGHASRGERGGAVLTIHKETIIERVARALLIANENLRICSGPSPCMDGPCSCTINLHQMARAAIAAMREPTREMIADGLTAIENSMESTADSYQSWDYAVDGTAYAGWRAMIDAALKEGE
jgi:hypothetical protein